MLKDLVSDKIKRENISIREAARQSNVSHSTINRILQGLEFDVDTMIAVCNWLGVEPSRVLNTLGQTDTLPYHIAAIVSSEPTLKELFVQIVADYERGEINALDVLDIVKYAMYRINTKKEFNRNDESQGTGVHKSN